MTKGDYLRSLLLQFEGQHLWDQIGRSPRSTEEDAKPGEEGSDEQDPRSHVKDLRLKNIFTAEERHKNNQVLLKPEAGSSGTQSRRSGLSRSTFM